MPAEEEKLLPCPFCNGKAELRQRGNDDTVKRFLTVRCKECRVELTNGAIHNGMDWLYQITIEAWNRRANTNVALVNMPTTAAAQNAAVVE
jgi:hypothetical protein